MVLIDHVSMKNCRLCQVKPGLYDLKSDKKLTQEIFDCVKVKVKDKSTELLPPSICEECKNTITSFSVFKQHIHKVDESLRKLLKSSQVKVKTDRELKCDKCPAEFKNEEIFNSHVRSHLPLDCGDEEKNVGIQCAKCEKVLESLEEYGVHQCLNECNVTTESLEQSTEDNLKEDHSDEAKSDQNLKFFCSFKDCQKVLRSAYCLKTHALKHKGIRPFLCVTCGKGFVTKNSLTCHEKIHLEVKGYVCKLCNIGFSVRSNLRAHEKKYHEGIKFYCSQCPKAYSSKCALERHERQHTGVKEFKCQSCASAFYTRKELLKHQIYHKGLRSHKCNECFKTFFERHHLIIHLRTHTGERPYVCKIPHCGKSFTESQKLRRHHKAKHA